MAKEKNLKKYVKEAINLAKDHLDKNPGDNKGIQELAAAVHINRNVLQKGFKQLFGTRISEYRLRQRMETAKKLLDGGIMTMKQISAACGYKSPSNFSTAFKEYLAIHPQNGKRRMNKMSQQSDCAKIKKK